MWDKTKKIISKVAWCLLFILFIARIFGGWTIFKVSGPSMNPTYTDGQYLIGSAWTLDEIERGDIVIAESPTGKDVIKRVIALPNETIEVIDGKVFIDGEEIDESYLVNTMFETENHTAITLDDDQYFIMGDNRNMSTDSRIYGPIERKAILSKIFVFE